MLPERGGQFTGTRRDVTFQEGKRSVAVRRLVLNKLTRADASGPESPEFYGPMQL